MHQVLGFRSRNLVMFSDPDHRPFVGTRHIGSDQPQNGPLRFGCLVIGVGGGRASL